MRFCMFCSIVQGRAKATIWHEDTEVLAFTDAAPRAPVHILIVPRRHIETLTDAADDPELLGRLLATATEIATRAGIAESGYRVVVNSGHDAMQTVAHLHLHLMGGAPLPMIPATTNGVHHARPRPATRRRKVV